MNVLICKVHEQSYAFDLLAIEHIVLAVEVTPLPKLPSFVLGAINIHGNVVPLINLRQLLDKPDKPIEVKDHFIVCRAHNRLLALCVDQVLQVKTIEKSELLPANQMLEQCDSIEFVIKEGAEIILLYDLEKLVPDHELV